MALTPRIFIYEPEKIAVVLEEGIFFNNILEFYWRSKGYGYTDFEELESGSPARVVAVADDLIRNSDFSTLNSKL